MNGKTKEQILKVRDDGRTNMLDVNGVMRIASSLGLYELVAYLSLRDNRNEYWHFIMTGEASIEDDQSSKDDEEEMED